MEIEHVQCSRCGCRGIHACIGYRMPTMTTEKKAELLEAIKKAEILRYVTDKPQELK